MISEQDFNEHGIAPKKLQIKSDYKDEINEPRLFSRTTDVASALEDLIKPTRNTIGVKMLRKMGWREGQGVGPRIKRKLRNLKSKITHGK